MAPGLPLRGCGGGAVLGDRVIWMPNGEPPKPRCTPPNGCALWRDAGGVAWLPTGGVGRADCCRCPRRRAKPVRSCGVFGWHTLTLGLELLRWRRRTWALTTGRLVERSMNCVQQGVLGAQQRWCCSWALSPSCSGAQCAAGMGLRADGAAACRRSVALRVAGHLLN
eukprot:61073-Prymnesium_polylepis.2